MDYTQLVQLAKEIARKHVLDPALICAIVEQESDWIPWAIRYEPAFQKRYVEPLGLANQTEIVARSMSWGLMQTMLQSVREIGYHGHAAELCDPFTALEWGCQLFGRKLDAAKGDVHAALQLWNGGGNPAYGQQVLARVEKYWVDAQPDGMSDKAK